MARNEEISYVETKGEKTLERLIQWNLKWYKILNYNQNEILGILGGNKPWVVEYLTEANIKYHIQE